MPKLEDIEQLKKIVDSLGNEQAVRQERGEAAPEVAPPEQTLSSDLEDLLGLSGEAGAEASPIDFASLDTTPVPEDLQLDDISQALGESGEQVPESEEAMGLDVLPETFGAGPAEGGEPATGDDREASALEGFDVPDFEAAAAEIAEPGPGQEPPETGAVGEMPEIPAAQSGGEPPVGSGDDIMDMFAEASEESGTPAMSEMSVEEPLGEPPDAGDERMDMVADAPEESPAPEMPGLPAEEPPGETSNAEEDLSDMFSMPETGLEEPIAEPVPADAFAAPEGGETPEFDLSDFQISEETPTETSAIPPASDAGLGGFDPSAGEPIAPAAESVFDQETAELPSVPESGVDLDQFNLPDFSDLGGTTGEIKPESGAGTGGLEAQMFDLPEGEEPFTPETGGDPEDGGVADAFASFEMPDLAEIEGGFGAEPPGIPPEEPAPFTEPPAAVPDRLNMDEFQLPDFGAPPEPSEEPEPAPGLQELAGVEEDISISQHDFENVKDTLATLPLNLKIIIEELIGEKDLKGPRLKRLLDALVAGESPKAIADIITSITGQKIILPKSFEKKTGIAFERDKDSFAYFLRTKGLKALALIGVAVMMAFILVVGGYQYVIKPMTVLPLYDQGYRDILAGRLEDGKSKFYQATNLWDSRDQYYRFADAYRENAPGAYSYPDGIYQQLLRRYPGDVRGTIGYARLKTLETKYGEARDLLEGGLLLRDMNNFDGLTALADNYLAWAEEEPSKLKDADYYYNILAERYPHHTGAQLKRLEFYVRSERIASRTGGAPVDNIQPVTNGTLELKRRGYDVVDPGIYALVAEYLIDKDHLDLVPELVSKALLAAPAYAPAAYERARYYRSTGEPEKEQMALEQAISLFANPEPDKGRGYLLANERRDSAERAAKLVLAQDRLAELYIGQDKPELAEDLLLKAQSLYESRVAELNETRFAAGGAFGRVYYHLGNIALGNDNLDRALSLYGRAEENGFSDPDQTYKKGFIRYRRADYDAALLEFHRANGVLPENENVLFALATTEYRRRQYQIAEGYYLYAAKLMRAQVDAVPELRPDDNPRDLDLLTNLYVTYNNLGCTYFKESNNNRARLTAEALDYLRQAAEIYDVISRYPDSLKRYEDTMVVKRRGGERLPNQQRVAPPFYNQDVIYHNKAGTVFLNERIDVVIYDLAYADLESPKLIGGDRRPGR